MVETQERHAYCPQCVFPMGRPVKEFPEFVPLKGVEFIQSPQSGWTPSKEHREVGEASPCCIMALHMAEEQGYQKPRLNTGWEG